MHEMMKHAHSAKESLMEERKANDEIVERLEDHMRYLDGVMKKAEREQDQELEHREIMLGIVKEKTADL